MKRIIAVLGLLCCVIAWAGTPPPLIGILQGNEIKFFAPNLNINDAAKFLTGSVDPTAVATDAPAGSLFLRSTGNVYVKLDAGSTVNWTLLANSSSTVTSVGLALDPSVFAISNSPVVNSGVLTGTFIPQNPNMIFAGPASGSAIPPTFRLLDPLDIPSLDASKITSGQGSISTSTTGVTIGNGASSTVGPNVTVDVQAASGSQPGLLTAANFNTFNGAATMTSAASSSNISSVLVKRDISGGFAAGQVSTGSVLFRDSGANVIGIQSPSAVSTYALILPPTQGSSSQTLLNDGAGNLSWASILPASLPSGQIFIGSVGNTATPQTISGDVVSITNGGVTTLKNTGTPGAYYKVNTDAQGRVTSGNTSLITSDLPALTSASIWIGNGSNSAAVQPLTGDISLSNAGVTAVNTVGGSSAANIHSAELAANASTNLNTSSAIVRRDSSGNFSAGTMTGNVTGNLTGNVTGNVSGTAGSFTGALLGDVTGTQASTVVSLVGGSSAANVHSAELAANAATNINTASTIVKRDGSGNFSAGVISGALTGNVTGNVSGSSATFTSPLVGDVTGNQGSTVVGKIQGSAVSITAPTDAQLLIWNNGQTRYNPSSLSGDATITNAGALTVGSVGTSSASNIHSAELAANAATNLNTISTIVKRDGSGNFSAGTIIAALTGNVTGNVSGSSGSFTGSLVGDVTGNQSATVVSTVGGSSAANVHSAELAANAASSNDTSGNTIVKRSGGAFTTGAVTATGAAVTGVSTTALTVNNTTLVADSSNGAIGINTAPASTAVLDVVNNSGATKAVQITGYGSNVGFRGRFARGTLATPTSVLLDDIIEFISGRGYGATGFATASTGSINISAGANFTDSSMPTYISLSTTPVSSVTSAEAMRVNSTGNVLIGKTTDDATNKLQVNGSASVTNEKIAGTAGAGYINFNNQSSAAPNPTTSVNLFANTSGHLSMIESGSFIGSFSLANLTANRTYTLPDTSGTFAFAVNFGGDFGTGGTQGMVPPPPSGSGTTSYLKANGSWTTAVSSVAVTVPSDFTITGSPITTTGTLAITRNTQSANMIFAGPASGGVAVPTYRAFVVGDSNPDLSFFFGDGSDGNVTVNSGLTALSRDMYYNNLTLSGSGQIYTAGYKIFVLGTLDMTHSTAGAFNNDGAVGGNASAQAKGASGGLTAAGSVGGGGAGGAGSTATSTTGTAASAGSAQNPSNSQNGGAGSTGGAGTNVGSAAGNGGSTTAYPPFHRFTPDPMYNGTTIDGGSGGGGGGSGGGDGTHSGAGGGAGGSGGGSIFIAANTIARGASTSVSSILAQGGAGGGPGTDNAACTNCGGAGGSGGGSGGFIMIYYANLTGSIATNMIDASGGAGGAGGNAIGGTGGKGGSSGGGGNVTLFNINTNTSTTNTGSAAVSGTVASGTTGGPGAPVNSFLLSL